MYEDRSKEARLETVIFFIQRMYNKSRVPADKVFEKPLPNNKHSESWLRRLEVFLMNYPRTTSSKYSI